MPHQNGQVQYLSRDTLIKITLSSIEAHLVFTFNKNMALCPYLASIHYSQMNQMNQRFGLHAPLQVGHPDTIAQHTETNKSIWQRSTHKLKKSPAHFPEEMEIWSLIFGICIHYASDNTETVTVARWYKIIRSVCITRLWSWRAQAAWPQIIKSD
jgi:hypothetical protein